METSSSSIRYRANVTRNSKGYTVDWTVERTFSESETLQRPMEWREGEVLMALQYFGKKLEAAYPATVEANKPEKVTS